MNRQFEEVAIRIGQKNLKLFSGSVEFTDGCADQIWVEGFDGETIYLDRDAIMREIEAVEALAIYPVRGGMKAVLREHTDWMFKAALWWRLSTALEELFEDELAAEREPTDPYAELRHAQHERL